MNRKHLGNAGEIMAAEFLISKGHTILERGFRSKTGEIDLISLYGDCIHFVEVKTRTSFDYGLPREAVTRDKLRHIRNTAEIYLRRFQRTVEYSVNMGEASFLDYGYSIDVIEVMINHIEGVE